MTNDTQAFNVDFASQLMTFNYWENRRVWDHAIIPLTAAQFMQDTGYSWGTVQRECVHIMDGEWGWLQRIRRVAQPEKLGFDDLIDRQTIRNKWDAIQGEWDVFMQALTPEIFFKSCTFQFRGKPIDMPTGNVIFHVVNHGTTHRSEILRMVADVHQPADFDLSMMQYMTGAFRE